MDNLSATALAAKRARMSYGNYVALYGICKQPEPILVDEPMKVCKRCGRKFPVKSRKRNAGYCSDDCRDEQSREFSAMRYQKRKKAMEDGNG